MKLLMSIKQAVGIARSGFWWFTTYPDGAITYCIIIKARMVCKFCPNNVTEEISLGVTKSYCKVAHK